LKLVGSSIAENNIIDSIKYKSIHKTLKSLNNEIVQTSEKLTKSGYIENKTIENIKENDSLYVTKFNLGKRIKYIHIYIGRNPSIHNFITTNKKTDTITLPYKETENFLNQTLQNLEKKGFALAKLKLINLHSRKQILYADLNFESGQERHLNSIIVKYNGVLNKNSFPDGHLHQINKKYTKTMFNKDIVKKIHEDFNNFEFVSQLKYPEILLTKDTTKVYVYLEKRKSNSFDGFIGFSNNENNKLNFKGYLDLNLENTLKVGEQFSLYWKSDGNNQKTFKAGIELPYLFKSPLGMKAQIYIFKQDSIFQNTVTALDLGYLANFNTKIYLGYQSTESSDIQNTNNNTISDYKNSFIRTSLEYTTIDTFNSIFFKKTNISISLGYGNRKSTDITDSKTKQTYININAMHNFYINSKNYININYQNYFLKSDTYLINESYRFGGINSIRGFEENSLQASFMTAIISEFRHIVSQDLFINTIVDYGFYEDKSTNNKGNLIGVGFGMGIKTKTGFLKIAFTNGSSETQNIKFYNTITTISYNIHF